MLKTLMKVLGANAPRITPITDYLNILGEYNKTTLLTKDQNLVKVYKISGLSYIAVGIDFDKLLHSDRFSFLIRMKSGLECIVFIKKEKSKLYEKSKLTNANPYSQEIIEAWEKDFKHLNLDYYFVVSTKKEDLLDKVDKKLEKAESDFGFKEKKLANFGFEIKNFLADYDVTELNSDEIISFYATLLNAEETNLQCDKFFFDDYYNNADVKFEKNYFTRELPNKTIYSSFVSIKTYEAKEITRKTINNLITIDSDMYICLGFSPKNKSSTQKAIASAQSKTKEADTLERLEELKNQIEAEKTRLFDLSINILINENSLEKLENTIDTLIGTCKRSNLLPIRETIAQECTFFSLFPSLWTKCSARKRTQTSSVLATFLNFENEKAGQNFNSWGKEAVAILRNSLGKPYLFNFHLPILKGEDVNQLKVGHTLIIGKTGLGKTTLATFLMNGLFKYNINILALDKLQGMNVFTNFVEGEYHDLSESFKLNPFSLSPTEENKKFLQVFIQGLAGIDDENITAEQAEKKTLIADTIDRIWRHSEAESRSFSNFLRSLEDEQLKTILEPYKNGILDNEEDALNFEKNLSVLGMDGLLKDKNLTSIVALYIFQKLVSISREQNKGFFIFVDELREYLGNKTLASQLLTLILEARKINGVVAMGVQNIDFFDEMAEKMKSSFLTNIAHFIIYPTTSTEELDKMEKVIGLTEEEKEFLRTTSPIERKVLIKQGFSNEKGVKSSVIADLNLADLGNYLKVFSSSIGSVKKVKELKVQYPKTWREEYLRS